MLVDHLFCLQKEDFLLSAKLPNCLVFSSNVTKLTAQHTTSTMATMARPGQWPHHLNDDR